VIFGLGAAFGWGLADLLAAFSGRRIGSWATVVIAQLFSAAAITLVLVVARPDMGELGGVAWWLVPNSVLAAGAYVTLYRALELGPVAVVSPVLASYAVIPVLLAVVLLGESLRGLQVAGVTVTIVGAVLTSTDARALRAGTHKMPPGLPWGIASAFLFGIATYTLGWATQRAGWLPALWLARVTAASIFAVAAIVVLLVRGRRRAPVAGRSAVGRSALAFAMMLGLVDLIGTISYSRGAEIGLVSIVTAVSATYPLIPVFGSVALFGERPAPNQYAGVAMVIAGLMLLGFA
jgi:drug/metabolite transporter (DMT)-like permease